MGLKLTTNMKIMITQQGAILERNFWQEQLLYSEILHTGWLKLVTWLATSNQNASFLLWNIFRRFTLQVLGFWKNFISEFNSHGVRDSLFKRKLTECFVIILMMISIHQIGAVCLVTQIAKSEQKIVQKFWIDLLTRQAWSRIGRWPRPENTYHRGKYHCTADLLFDWFVFDQTSKT